MEDLCVFLLLYMKNNIKENGTDATLKDDDNLLFLRRSENQKSMNNNNACFYHRRRHEKCDIKCKNRM